MVFNPDRPKPREPRETSTGLMRIIGLLTAALTTEPAQAAQSHESAAIRLNVETLASDEAELTQTELRSQLNIFYSYLQDHDTTVDPFVQMKAILDRYVVLGMN